MKYKLSQSQIKIFVVILMSLGHVGHFIAPKTIWGEAFDIASQLTGVVMAYFIFEGYYHTRSLKRYVLRLTLCGIAAQIGLYLLGEERLNVCFSFVICLGILYVLNNESLGTAVKILLLLALFLASIMCEGEFLYPIFVSLLFFYKRNQINLLTAFIGAACVSFIWNFSAVVYYSLIRNIVYRGYGLECFLVFLIHAFGGFLLVSYAYDGDRVHNKSTSLFSKYFFYLFYPIQFVVIYFLSVLPIR